MTKLLFYFVFMAMGLPSMLQGQSTKASKQVVLTEETEALLVQLYFITGKQKIFEAKRDEILGQFRAIYPGPPPTYWEEVQALASDQFSKILYDTFKGQYKGKLTHQDLKAILAFYMTPEGMKWAQAQEELNEWDKKVLVLFTNNYSGYVANLLESKKNK